MLAQILNRGGPMMEVGEARDRNPARKNYPSQLPPPPLSRECLKPNPPFLRKDISNRSGGTSIRSRLNLSFSEKSKRHSRGDSSTNQHSSEIHERGNVFLDVFAIVLIFILGLLPLLLSLVLVRRMKQRWQARLRRIHSVTTFGARSSLSSRMSEEPIDLHDYFIGDLSCHYNARSPYIRCAVNPSGPCEGCSSYKPRERSEPRIEKWDIDN
ncbi:MAG: DUF6464 family protein [Cyanobacteriota bacterium]|nr:DUF6464 family protein [Cyanobacteriota bacterium]